MPAGYLALILHAHLPFVRHPEHEEFLEEDWLYEAITETYIPLIDVFERLMEDGIDFRITMSLTPPLCAMLRDPLLQERYVRHIEKLIELSQKEVDRTRFDEPFHRLATFYHERFTRCREVFAGQYQCNLLEAFRKFQQAGKLEIITCAATHGFLPLMTEHPEAIRAQIMTAREDYHECFGRDPVGIWLPECAYVPGIDRFVQEANIRWFVLDAHGILFADPRPRFGIFSPLFTPGGPAAFGRDMESSKQVWSAEQGYPGDPVYRDFYRDAGFDLEYDYVRPYIQPNGNRKFTGIKYHRITGKGPYKDLYDRQPAVDRAAEHAGNFMHNRQQQIDYLSKNLGRPPIVLSPYDAELFGHWWFEGPEFLDALLRKIACDQDTIRTTTPGEYLMQYPTQQVATPAASSWGNKGFYEVWVDGSNSWIYPHLHEAARRMIDLAHQHRDTQDELVDRCLRQMARELMLAQSSDWAFIMRTGTMVPYAVKRTKDHILRFNRLAEQLSNSQIDDAFLDNCEWRDNIFPHLDWRHYL